MIRIAALLGLLVWASIMPANAPANMLLSGAASVALPCDAATSCVFAFGARKLRAAYAGNVVQVRRASDNTTQNIGFSGNDLDTSSFSTFCAATTCFAATWYDQSGNGHDCTQATNAAQAQVQLAQINGHPALTPAGVQYCQAATSAALDFTGNSSVFYVLQSTNAFTNETVSHYNSASFAGWAADINAGITRVFAWDGSTAGTDLISSDLAAVNNGSQHLVGWTITSSSKALQIYRDGVTGTIPTGTFPAIPTSSGQPMTVMAAGDAPVDTFLNGQMAEMYGWAKVLTSTEIAAVNSSTVNYWATSSGGPFSPSTVSDLAFWYDPSDSTTVFTDTACTTPAVATNTVSCIKDKSANRFDMVLASGTAPTLVNNSGVWYLDFTANAAFSATASGALALYKNAPYGLIHGAGRSYTHAASGDYPFMYFATATSSSTRIGCGYDFAGVGWGLRMRTLDADAAVNVAVGSEADNIDAVLRCDVRWAAGTANIYVDNVASTTGTPPTTANTSNTASAKVSMGGDVDLAAFLNGRIYGIVGEKPTAAPSSSVSIQIDTWLCAKQGRTC